MQSCKRALKYKPKSGPNPKNDFKPEPGPKKPESTGIARKLDLKMVRVLLVMKLLIADELCNNNNNNIYAQTKSLFSVAKLFELSVYSC